MVGDGGENEHAIAKVDINHHVFEWVSNVSFYSGYVLSDGADIFYVGGKNCSNAGTFQVHHYDATKPDTDPVLIHPHPSA